MSGDSLTRCLPSCAGQSPVLDDLFGKISHLLVEALGARRTRPAAVWLTADDLAFYVAELGRSGFRGGLNHYRNINVLRAILAPFVRATDRPTGAQPRGSAGPRPHHRPRHPTRLTNRRRLARSGARNRSNETTPRRAEPGARTSNPAFQHPAKRRTRTLGRESRRPSDSDAEKWRCVRTRWCRSSVARTTAAGLGERLKDGPPVWRRLPTGSAARSRRQGVDDRRRTWAFLASGAVGAGETDGAARCEQAQGE